MTRYTYIQLARFSATGSGEVFHAVAASRRSEIRAKERTSKRYDPFQFRDDGRNMIISDKCDRSVHFTSQGLALTFFMFLLTRDKIHAMEISSAI